MFNKKIASEFALGVIVILAVIFGGYLWWQGRQELNGTKKMINTAPDRKIKESEENKQIVSSGVEEAVSDWQTYRNEKYGFELKFANSWKGYVAESQQGELDPTVEIISFKIPSNINKYGYVVPKNIFVYPLNDWDKLERKTPIIARNNKYVFTYGTWSDPMPELKEINDSIPQILATFKFIN